MISPQMVRLLQPVGLIALTSTVAIFLEQPAAAQNQRLSRSESAQLADDTQPADPEIVRPLDREASVLSMLGGQRLMSEAAEAVNNSDYALAVKKLQEARQIFNQLSNFYQELAASFTGIDNRIADRQRRQAVESAELRDEATYQLALVHRAKNQPELSVPLLVQIIRSQNPTRDLGKKAYRQLFELGFVDSPYPRPRDGESTSSNQ